MSMGFSQQQIAAWDVRQLQNAVRDPSSAWGRNVVSRQIVATVPSVGVSHVVPVAAPPEDLAVDEPEMEQAPQRTRSSVHAAAAEELRRKAIVKRLGELGVSYPHRLGTDKLEARLAEAEAEAQRHDTADEIEDEVGSVA